MKKIISYIFLILIVFANIFSVNIAARAAQTTGYCLDKDKNLLYNFKDPSSCTNANKENIWVPTSTNTVGGQKGICISETTSSPTSDPDPASCEANGGRWEGPTPGILRNTDYKLLQPLPCKGGETAGCDANGQLTVFDPTGTSKLGEYLNLMITLFIGLCAVAAVVMIVIGGIQYSTSELIGGKEEAKNRILNAIFGLVLALGSYAILYTINPDLLKTEIDIGGTNITSQGEVLINPLADIRVTGPDGTVKIITNKSACEAAKLASQTTGVDSRHLMAMFWKESVFGTGWTGSTGYNSWPPEQRRCFDEISGTLGLNRATIKGSYAGAIGYTQFIPCTLKGNLPKAIKVLGGRAPNLWNSYDALVLTGIKIKQDVNGTSRGCRAESNSVRRATCSYYGACSSVLPGGKVNYYCNDVENYINKSQCR